MNSNVYNYGVFPLLVLTWGILCMTVLPVAEGMYITLIGGIIIVLWPVEMLGWVHND